MYKTLSIPYLLFNSQSIVVQTYWLILWNSEKTTSNNDTVMLSIFIHTVSAVAVLNNGQEYWFRWLFNIHCKWLYCVWFYMFECFEHTQAIQVTGRYAKDQYVAYLRYFQSDALCCQSGLGDTYYYHQVFQLRSVRSLQQLHLLCNTSHALIDLSVHYDKAGLLIMGKTTTCEVRTKSKSFKSIKIVRQIIFTRVFRQTWFFHGSKGLC